MLPSPPSLAHGSISHVVLRAQGVPLLTPYRGSGPTPQGARLEGRLREGLEAPFTLRDEKRERGLGLGDLGGSSGLKMIKGALKSFPFFPSTPAGSGYVSFGPHAEHNACRTLSH